MKIVKTIQHKVLALTLAVQIFKFILIFFSLQVLSYIDFVLYALQGQPVGPFLRLSLKGTKPDSFPCNKIGIAKIICKSLIMDYNNFQILKLTLSLNLLDYSILGNIF